MCVWAGGQGPVMLLFWVPLPSAPKCNPFGMGGGRTLGGHVGLCHPGHLQWLPWVRGDLSEQASQAGRMETKRWVWFSTTDSGLPAAPPPAPRRDRMIQGRKSSVGELQAGRVTQSKIRRGVVTRTIGHLQKPSQCRTPYYTISNSALSSFSFYS